ncbi:MAG: Protein translocase subunit SecE, partial [uncultured Nocardioidaceae bacterium]
GREGHRVRSVATHQSGDLLPPGGRRAPQGRLADAAAADHLLLGGAGVRDRGHDDRVAARPGLRQGHVRALRL